MQKWQFFRSHSEERSFKIVDIVTKKIIKYINSNWAMHNIEMKTL